MTKTTKPRAPRVGDSVLYGATPENGRETPVPMPATVTALSGGAGCVSLALIGRGAANPVTILAHIRRSPVLMLGHWAWPAND